MEKQSKILDGAQIDQKITRIAHQVYESHFGEKEIVLVGIVKRGYVVAEMLAQRIESISKLKVRLCKLTMDKSDPLDGNMQLDVAADVLKSKRVLVVDDVVNSGGTLMYACGFVMQQPLKSLSTVVLVDREHRRYPIKSDFAGLTLSTTLHEHIEVKLSAKSSAVFLS